MADPCGEERLGRHQSGEGLAEGFGDGDDVAVEANDRVLFVHQHLDARRDGDAAARGGRAGASSTGASQPSTARPTRPRPVPGACSSASRSGRGSAAPSTPATRRSMRSPVSPANSRVIVSSVAPSI